MLRNHFGQTALRRKERDEAGLQGVVDVALAGEEAVGRLAVFGQFLEPAAVFAVEIVVGDIVPDLAVALFVEVAFLMLVEEMGGGGAFAERPPEFAALVGGVFPVERVEEAALVLVPTQRHGLEEEAAGCFRHPVMALAAQHPELEDEAGPFEPMAGRCAGRAEHLVRMIVGAVDDPVLVEVLGDPEGFLPGAAVDDQVGDPLRLGEVMPLAGCLKSGHQAFGEVHVGILTTITGHRLPVT